MTQFNGQGYGDYAVKLGWRRPTSDDGQWTDPKGRKIPDVCVPRAIVGELRVQSEHMLEDTLVACVDDDIAKLDCLMQTMCCTLERILLECGRDSWLIAKQATRKISTARRLLKQVKANADSADD
jgi:hypothetical protein